MKSDLIKVNNDIANQKLRIKENLDKVKKNKQLPFLVANMA